MSAAPEDEFTLDEPFDATHLPQNYLPAAARALRGDVTAADRVVMLLPPGSEAPARGVDFAVVPAALLAEPRKFDVLAADLPLPGLGGGAAGLVLGPPTRREATSGPQRIVFAAAKVAAKPCLRRVLVVIDTGIAFWNGRFRDGAGCRFREIQYLDFDHLHNGSATGVTIDRLRQSELDALCLQSDAPGGQRAVMASLGQQFPGSYFGPLVPPQRGVMWHGTAMADLAAGDLPDPEATALFGLELPRAALTDWGGDTLGGLLPAALQAALAMTAALAHLPCVLLLPFAFTGGPQDGADRVTQAVAQVLANARAAGRVVELVVPAGNHRQDRSVARLPAVGMGGGAAARRATIRLPPDDFSPATIEILQAAGGAAWTASAMSLRTPRGQTLPLALGPQQMVFLLRQGRRIGAVWRDSNLAGRARLRLTLFGTGRSAPAQVPAPAGLWQVVLASGIRADLWMLRDDSEIPADRTRPHRQAVFADAAWRARGPEGAMVMEDPPRGTMRRSGSASVLSTAAGVIVAQAQERWGGGAARTAWYGGRAMNGAAYADVRMVDDGWPSRGTLAVGNGTAQRFMVSGTSAAAALVARDLHA